MYRFVLWLVPTVEKFPRRQKVPAGGPAAGDGPRRAGASGRGDVPARPSAAFADGTIEEGPFVDGKYNGHWVLRSADGNVQEGPLV